MMKKHEERYRSILLVCSSASFSITFAISKNELILGSGMTDQKQISTHSPSLNILRKKRKTERSPSVDSYIMTSQEERRKSAAMVRYYTATYLLLGKLICEKE